MSSRTSKASAAATGQAALAFPILIRLPDLRAGETRSHAIASLPPAETAPGKTRVVDQSSANCMLAMTATEICSERKTAAEPNCESLPGSSTKHGGEVLATPSQAEAVQPESTSIVNSSAKPATPSALEPQSVATVEVAANLASETQVVEANHTAEIAAVMAEAVPSSEKKTSDTPADENASEAESVAVKGPVAGVATVAVKTEEPNTTPNAQSEGMSPAAARQQRALERARQQTAPVLAAASPRTWRSSHLPVIAVGFLLALIITVYIARSNRDTRSAQASPEIDVPLLDIDMGDSSDSPSASSPPPGMFAAEPSQPAVSTPELKPLSKSPPLLSATAPPADRTNPANSADAHATAKPVNADEHVGTTNEHFNERSTSESASNESAPSTAAEMATEADYPSTPPDVHRPGGRVPRTARTLTYPQTSTPHLR